MRYPSARADITPRTIYTHMKKTLITLAALAMASVAQAVSVDFTSPTTLPSEVSFAGDATDVITLAGATTIFDNVITYGSTTVTNTNTDKNVNGILFNHAGDTSSGILRGATINFGTSGSLTLDLTHQSALALYNRDVNLAEQQLIFNASLDFIQETDDESLIGTKVVVYRDLVYGVAGLWNNTGSNNSYTLNISNYNDASVTLVDMTNEPASDRRALDLTVEDGVGAWQMYTPDANNIKIAYVVQYVAAPVTPAVPEPATATLSLLALTGLAARRRRK